MLVREATVGARNVLALTLQLTFYLSLSFSSLSVKWGEFPSLCNKTVNYKKKKKNCCEDTLTSFNKRMNQTQTNCIAWFIFKLVTRSICIHLNGAAAAFKIKSNKFGGLPTRKHELHFREILLINLIKIRNILLSKFKDIQYTNSKIQPLCLTNKNKNITSYHREAARSSFFLRSGRKKYLPSNYTK